MAERSEEEIAMLSRRDLAQVHANEMSAAVNPAYLSMRADDDISDDEKQGVAEVVAQVTEVHRREVALWMRVNG